MGAGRVISKLVTFANAVLTVSNTYFLVPFYMYFSGQLIHCLKIRYQEIRTIFKEQFEAEIAKKLRTAQPQPKVTRSYKKKKACTKNRTIKTPSCNKVCILFIFYSKICKVIIHDRNLGAKQRKKMFRKQL